ncbi:hypothetical protein [Serratia fonticola]|uniref:hypothetical protein n=1 Tax=Serratia fonticola TaxID=47917 RepID=UPI00093B3363|nr:hypothetical protein [Serratia fonticola]OKP29777.1 hypothetical protein BSQ40_08070 [Serratia fonticola]
MPDLSKDGIRLHKTNFEAIGKQLLPLLESGNTYRLILKPWRNKRSLPQNDLSHMWYAEISKQLMATGRSHCTPKWVKKNLKKTFLGYEVVEDVDLISGEVTERYELRKTSELDTGDMHFYLQQVEAWCGSLGIEITIPAESEYNQLKQKQVA